MIDLTKMITAVKHHPRYHESGMILCHNGVVRSTSRDGRNVTGLRITVDHVRLKQVIDRNKCHAGIVEILVEINEEKDLRVGDDVMYIVVAGDVRENVMEALSNTLNEVKATVTSKTEFYQ